VRGMGRPTPLPIGGVLFVCSAFVAIVVGVELVTRAVAAPRHGVIAAEAHGRQIVAGGRPAARGEQQLREGEIERGGCLGRSAARNAQLLVLALMALGETLNDARPLAPIVCTHARIIALAVEQVARAPLLGVVFLVVPPIALALPIAAQAHAQAVRL